MHTVLKMCKFTAEIINLTLAFVEESMRKPCRCLQLMKPYCLVLATSLKRNLLVSILQWNLSLGTKTFLLICEVSLF